jgi:hypothetical protein
VAATREIATNTDTLGMIAPEAWKNPINLLEIINQTRLSEPVRREQLGGKRETFGNQRQERPDDSKPCQICRFGKRRRYRFISRV